MPASEVLAMVMEAAYSDISVTAYYPRLLSYRYRGALEFMVDSVTARLVRIDLHDGHRGTYMGKVRVGSTVRELRAVNSELAWDEEFVLVGPDWGLIARLDTDDTIRDLDSVLDEPIAQFTLELPGWTSSPSPGPA